MGPGGDATRGSSMDAHKYFGFSDWADVIGQFGPVPDHDMTEPELAYAVYSTPAYEGSATVVYRRDGQWFENSGGHCSCYGLEDQWGPTPLDPQVHLTALTNGKRDLCVADTEGDYPEATQEAFDAWFAAAVGS